MTKKVRTLEGNKPLSECVKMMRDANVGSVVVVENNTPVGIFTERDLIKNIAHGKESLELNMAQVMSKPLRSISSSATLWDAVTVMGSYDIRRLPVVDDAKLVGILTEKDIFRLILSQQSLLLESVAESIPVKMREQLKGFVTHLGTEKPPARAV